jgi:hypothetical protein
MALRVTRADGMTVDHDRFLGLARVDDAARECVASVNHGSEGHACVSATRA